MARIAGGFGTSHSPQLCIPPEGWRPHGDRDVASNRLDGLPPSTRPPFEVAAELSDEVIAARFEACQQAMATIGRELGVLRPTVLVIVGDDERELFSEGCMPTLAVYWGDGIADLPPGIDKYPETMWAAYGAYHADEPESYPVSAPLGMQLIEHMVTGGFDLTQLSVQPDGRSVGHAFTFVRRRIVGPDCPPIVPVLLNTYYPPNQPTAARCLAIGRGMRAAIEAWSVDADVVLVASGGLSHPIIHEDLDRGVLKALETMDEDYLTSIPPEMLVQGSSEIRNWIVVGAALADFGFEVIDYVPAYRSHAGSGCGMGFARWSAP